MSFFGYATAAFTKMSNAIVKATEAVANAISEPEPKQATEKDVKTPLPENKLVELVQKEETPKKKKESEFVMVPERGEMDDYHIVQHLDLYVIMYDNENGVVTEENVLIPYEESTRHH